MDVEKIKESIRQHPFFHEFLVRAYNAFKIMKNNPGVVSQIWKLWKDRSSYVAPSPVSHSDALPSEDGFCYFIPFLYKRFGKRALFNLIRNRKYKTIALVGDYFRKNYLLKVLKKEFPDINFRSFVRPDSVAEPFDVQDIQAVILATFSGNAISLFRTLINILRYPGDLIVEGRGKQYAIQTRSIESSKPIVVCAYPCAGTNRFIFGFEYLMKKLSWKSTVFSPFIRNVRYLQSLEGIKPSDELADESFKFQIHALDYFQWMNTHEYFTLSKVKDLDCRFVVLMRDPRDIINSIYWRTVYEVSDKSSHIHRIIDGYTRYSGFDYAFNWPSAGKIVDNYLVALNHTNFFVIRFEDLHKDEIAAFKKLLTELQLYPHALVQFTDEDFRHVLKIGSFEYQTGNKYRRGQHNLAQGKEYVGADSKFSCRKGTVGDWKSCFTKEAIDHFKAVTGDGLVKLGYEKDENW